MTPTGPDPTEERPDGQRRCPVCRESFTPNPRSPNHTYCSDRCRSAAWYARHGPRRPRSPTPTADAVEPITAVTNAVDATSNAVDAMTNDVNSADALTNRGAPDPVAIDGVNTIQLCPHCRQPISLLTLVVTPTAAHVAVPEPPALAHRARRRPT